MRGVGALLSILALAGCVDGSALGPQAAALEPGAPQEAAAAATFDWNGRILAGPAAELLSHQRPTEDLLWPLQQAGFKADVPEGVRTIEVALAWSGPADLILMLHSHNHSGGPNDIIMHQTAWGSPNPHCLRVPSADVVPGAWEFMARAAEDAVDVDFTMTILTEGGEPTVLNEYHGHDRISDVRNGRSDDTHEVEPCTLWSPPAG